MFVVTSSFEGWALAGLRPQGGLDLLLIPLQIDESFGIKGWAKSFPVLIDICWSRDRQVE